MAAIKGQWKSVNILVNHSRTDINIVDSQQMSPFHHACANGHVEVVKELLRVSTKSIDALDHQQRSPLHHACENGHVEVVKELLRVSAKSIDALDHQQMSPLHIASRGSSLEVLQELSQASLSQGSSERTDGHDSNTESKNICRLDALDVNCRALFGYAFHHWQLTNAMHLLPLTSLSSIGW